MMQSGQAFQREQGPREPHPRTTGPTLPNRAAAVLVALGIIGIFMPLSASAESTAGRDGLRVLIYWFPSLALIFTGAIIGGRAMPRRFGTALLIGVLVSVWLAHPVCERIADEEVPLFETVVPLQQRAKGGEPFRNIKGHWYQCKSWISRQLFF
jgi:hypothetical protein